MFPLQSYGDAQLHLYVMVLLWADRLRENTQALVKLEAL